jgi:hypothetical protein
MRLLQLGCVCALALSLLPAIAHADGAYLTLGIGNAPDLGGTVGVMFDESQDGRSGRIAIGQRYKFVALEADWTGAELSRMGTGESWDTSTLGFSAKLIAPIFGRLEAFGRAGLTLTWLGAQGADTRYSGGGHVLGAGMQLELGFTNFVADLWAEYARHSMNLHDREKETDDVDGSLDTLMVGLSLGF